MVLSLLVRLVVCTSLSLDLHKHKLHLSRVEYSPASLALHTSPRLSLGSLRYYRDSLDRSLPSRSDGLRSNHPPAHGGYAGATKVVGLASVPAVLR